MKSNYLLLLLYSFMFFSVKGQIIEDFSTAKLSTSYKSDSFIGAGSIRWYYDLARGGQSTTDNNNEAISFSKSADARLYSDTIPWGIKSIRFQYEQELTTNCNASVWINDSCIATITTNNEEDLTKYFEADNLNFKGKSVIKIMQNAANSGQLTIDDIAIEFYVAPPAAFNIISHQMLHDTIIIHCTQAIATAELHVTPQESYKYHTIQDSTLTIVLQHNAAMSHFCASLSDVHNQIIRDTCIHVSAYYMSAYNSVSITELMIRPQSQFGLPQSQYIELYNNTSYTCLLSLFTLCIGSQEYNLPAVNFPAHSYIVLVPEKSVSLFDTTAIRVAGVKSFPTLPLSNKQIAIKLGSTILASLKYEDSWYESKIKQSGGWSLEKKDIRNASESPLNWSASVAVNGGTPGIKNSIQQDNPDTIAWTINKLYVVQEDKLYLSTSKNSTIGNMQNTIAIEEYAGSMHIVPIESSLQEFYIILNPPLERGNIYTLYADDSLCDYNNHCYYVPPQLFGITDTIRSKGDIYINEILVNPATGTQEFIELYNASELYYDMSHIIIANRDTTQNDINTFTRASLEPLLFPPKSYAVLSKQADYYKSISNCSHESLFIPCQLPSYPIQSGSIIITTLWNHIIDSLTYNSSWHSESLRSSKGISLERIDIHSPTQQADNWVSAPVLEGGNSVGCGNYASRNYSAITLDKENTLLTPYTDNRENIRLQFSSLHAEQTLAVYVFNLRGEKIRTLANNVYVGNAASIEWDGNNDSGTLVRQGSYIILVEAFTDGKRTYRKKITCSVIY